MPHNQISNNQEIMLDSKNPSNQNSLLQYEAHIKLMYRYVKLHNFMEAKKRNDYTDVK